MSDLIKAIILGIIEGLTEFIPVSSTGHLIIAGDWLQFSAANTETFDIAIQLGAILAVVIIYRDFFINLLLKTRWFGRQMNTILIAILPALGLGFLAHSFIKTYLFSTNTVLVGLFIGAILMIIFDLKNRKQKNQQVITDIENISYIQALQIGLWQCLALWPGMSRSGSTIVGGLQAKLSYALSAKFSFIIAVPVMFAAVSYDLLKSWSTLTTTDFIYISVGFVISFIVALGAIMTFLKLLQRFKLIPFALYRIAIVILILFLKLF